MQKKKLNTVVEAIEDCEIIFVAAEALSSFLQANPGLQILFKDALVIE
jgi:hypothetical protein